MKRQYAKRSGKAGFGPNWERSTRSGADEHVMIYGIHPVQAALANAQRPIHTLLLTRNAEQRLAQELERRQITPERVLPKDIDRRLGPEAVHQGALLETDALPEPSLSDLAERANEKPLVILDHVTDPHNVGAILRSAAVFGASGLIMTRRHSPPLDGTLAKSASGVLFEHVPVLLVQNLAHDCGAEGTRRRGYRARLSCSRQARGVGLADLRRPCARRGRTRTSSAHAGKLRSSPAHLDRQRAGQPQRLQRRGDRFALGRRAARPFQLEGKSKRGTPRGAPR